MIRIKCEAPEEYNDEEWPSMLEGRPEQGEFIQSESGVRLFITSIGYGRVNVGTSKADVMILILNDD